MALLIALPSYGTMIYLPLHLFVTDRFRLPLAVPPHWPCRWLRPELDPIDALDNGPGHTAQGRRPARERAAAVA